MRLLWLRSLICEDLHSSEMRLSISRGICTAFLCICSVYFWRLVGAVGCGGWRLAFGAPQAHPLVASYSLQQGLLSAFTTLVAVGIHSQPASAQSL